MALEFFKRGELGGLGGGLGLCRGDQSISPYKYCFLSILFLVEATLMILLQICLVLNEVYNGVNEEWRLGANLFALSSPNFR